METQTIVVAPEGHAQMDQNPEAEINEQIATLWATQKDHAATAQRSREELKAVRASLAERLHALKSLLVQTGRGGRWAAYLREHRIPRATADRYVNRHESAFAPSGGNRLIEAISAPTEEDVHRLLQKLLPNMRRVLTTQGAAFTFVAELIVALPGLQGDVTDTAALVFRPVEELVSVATVQHASPEALQVVA